MCVWYVRVSLKCDMRININIRQQDSNFFHTQKEKLHKYNTLLNYSCVPRVLLVSCLMMLFKRCPPVTHIFKVKIATHQVTYMFIFIAITYKYILPATISFFSMIFSTLISHVFGVRRVSRCCEEILGWNLNIYQSSLFTWYII